MKLTMAFFSQRVDPRGNTYDIVGVAEHIVASAFPFRIRRRDPCSGGTGGTGEFDLMPSFLSSQSASGFWVVLGEAGRPSAGETTPVTNFVAFNGGGAGTGWSNAENTYTRAAGGGTDNGAMGGAGGGFNNPGSSGTGDPEFGTGATTSVGGSIGGVLCNGGNGLQDHSEGWVGGGGGGYYGGGASYAHEGGGGGSGYLLADPGLVQVTTTDGTQGGNAATDRHGAFTITVN